MILRPSHCASSDSIFDAHFKADISDRAGRTGQINRDCLNRGLWGGDLFSSRIFHFVIFQMLPWAFSPLPSIGGLHDTMNEASCLGGASHADAAGDRSGEQLRLAMLLCMKFGQQDHALDLFFIVQTDTHVFLDNRQLKFDGF